MDTPLHIQQWENEGGETPETPKAGSTVCKHFREPMSCQQCRMEQREKNREVGDCWDCGRTNTKLYMKGLCATCYVADNY